MRTRRRAALIGLFVVIGLLGVGWLGLRAYLGSSGARSAVAARLSESFGLPVEVESLSVGMSSSSVKFRVTEPAEPGKSATEVLRVESATADVSLVGMATDSAAPSHLTLRGLALTLHIDRDGHLLTTLPKPSNKEGGGSLPAIRAEDVAVTLKQDGRPDFVMSKGTLDLTPGDGKLVLKGTADDPQWGKWEIAGHIDPTPGTGTFDLTTADGPLREDLLRSIPFIPPSTWDHVRPTGRSAAKVSLTRGADAKFAYDVTLTPAGKGDVFLHDLDVPLAGVTGTIRVHAAKVELADCSAKLADGTVRVGGDLDFGPEPSVLKFAVRTEGVDVRKLPDEWGLPKQFEGKLRGKADLELKVHADGRIDPRGGGAATLEGAKLAGLPAEVRLRLRGDGKRYRFDQDKPADAEKSSALPILPAAFFAVVQVQPTTLLPPPKPATEETTLDATVTLRDVDVDELLTRLEIKVPYRFGGKITVSATVTVPVATPDRTKTYRIRGSLTSPKAKFEGLSVRDLSAKVNYANGVLKLTELKGKVGDGSFGGSATAAVEPRGDVSASLDLVRLAIEEAVKAVPGGGPDLRGPVTGRAEFRAPLDTLADPAAWTASATVTSDELTAFGRTVKAAAINVKADRGTATLTDTRATVEGLPLTASGTLGLAKPYPVNAELKTRPVDAADLRRLIPELNLAVPVEGKIDTSAKITGNLLPFAVTASGSATATDLKIGTSASNRLSFKWDLGTERVKITDLSADLFGGRVTGSADVPLNATKAGKFSISFTDVDSAPATKVVADFPIRLTGRLSGKFAADVPAAKPGKPRAVTGDLDLTAPKLTVQGIPAERLTGKVGFADGAADYQLEGRALGGTFDVKGRYPSKPRAAPAADRGGSVRLRDLDLGRLAAATRSNALRELTGRVDLTLTYSDDLQTGSGRVAVRGLGWGDEEFADELGGTVVVRDGIAFLTDFGGRFAGGELRSRGRLTLADPGRNFFTLSLDRADAAVLFGPFAGDAAAGKVSVVLRGRLGTESRGAGQVSFDHGSLLGFAVNDLRVPFDWVAGTGGSGAVTVREAAGTAGSGRLTGELDYAWGASSRLSGKVRFAEVRLRDALGGLGQSSYIGNGRLTGRFDFAASPLHSADDLSGTLTGTLNQTSVQELPVFRLLTPYLSPTGVTTAFQAGEVKGRLARGTFRLERLSLSNPAAQLFAEGNISLAGRLDLDVVANTGQIGINDRGLRLLGLRLPLFIGPVPVSLIKDVSDYLSNRTIRLHVSGTTKQPSVQVNTAALVSEELVRFFLARYLPAGVGPASPFERDR